jgi:hypothetical protein
MSAWRVIAGALLLAACGHASTPAAHEAAVPVATPAPAATPAAPVAPAATRENGYQPPYRPPVAQPPALAAPATLTSESRYLLRHLDHVEVWALGGVGVTGDHSPGENMTRMLAEEPDAVEAFAWLAGHGHPISRLYAYWALRTLAPDRAQRFAAALEADRTVVPTASGCLDGRATIGGIARGMKTAHPSRAMPRPQPGAPQPPQRR